ncbi:MAG: hypothetical protein ABIK15_14955 [Pseudomonadota bacterium]
MKKLIPYLILLVIFSCASLNRQKEIDLYLTNNPDIPVEIKNAIKSQKIIIGMCPNEAVAAAGDPFFFVAKLDKKWPKGTYPPSVIMIQCENPDSSIFTLTFSNTTQYDDKLNHNFSVKFVHGKATEIMKRS